MALLSIVGVYYCRQKFSDDTRIIVRANARGHPTKIIRIYNSETATVDVDNCRVIQTDAGNDNAPRRLKPISLSFKVTEGC